MFNPLKHSILDICSGLADQRLGAGASASVGARVIVCLLVLLRLFFNFSVQVVAYCAYEESRQECEKYVELRNKKPSKQRLRKSTAQRVENKRAFLAAMTEQTRDRETQRESDEDELNCVRCVRCWRSHRQSDTYSCEAKGVPETNEIQKQPPRSSETWPHSGPVSL